MSVDTPPNDRSRAVRDAFERLGEHPDGDHPIPAGRALAEGVGYPPHLLDALPAAAVEAFAGVAYIHGWADIPPGCDVLDLGCGAGTDSLIAARRGAHVRGVDFAPAMLRRARAGALALGLSNVEFRQGSAEAIPAPDASFDVALVNGIFNLNPARSSIFSELVRVLRPGGVVYAAELVLQGPLPAEERDDPTSWFA